MKARLLSFETIYALSKQAIAPRKRILRIGRLRLDGQFRRTKGRGAARHMIRFYRTNPAWAHTYEDFRPVPAFCRYQRSGKRNGKLVSCMPPSIWMTALVA